MFVSSLNSWAPCGQVRRMSLDHSAISDDGVIFHLDELILVAQQNNEFVGY